MRQQLAEQQQQKAKWLSKIESTSVQRIGSDDHDVDEFSDDLFLCFKVCIYLLLLRMTFRPVNFYVM